MEVALRPFEDRDYERHAEIAVAIDPDTGITAEVLRYRDATFEPHMRLVRVAAEAEPGGLIGVGRLMHIWWNFHPRRYVMRIEVDPAWQRRGVGSQLFEYLLEQLRGWDAELVRSETRSDRPEGIAFLEHRGFSEWLRRWDSVLDVGNARIDRLLEADRRVAAQGITISTYAVEFAQRGDRFAHDLFEAEGPMARDVPGVEASGDMMPFERWLSAEVHAPGALTEAHFVALEGHRVVGVSRLGREPRRSDVLHVGFTGVDPQFRGRGIAEALKLRTVLFAREHGYREIRTGNDSTNAPIIHINDAIGFKREIATIVYERRLERPSL